MKYLVTGGAGFIGSAIVEELLRRGDYVRVIDNLSTGRIENISEFLSRIEFIEGDIRDFWTVREAVAGCDYVLHQAALPSVQGSVDNPLTSNAVNIDGLLNVLECARREKVKKVVFASSASVYGDAEELPKHEDMAANPLSPYAVAKLAGEHYMRVFWKLYGLPTVSLRYFNIFGPRQDPNSDYSAVIPKFIIAFGSGARPVVYGDGLQSRDFIYISHAVQANIIAATNTKITGAEYNVACGRQWTLNDLLDKLRAILGADNAAIYQDERPGDIKHSYGADEKLLRDFGKLSDVTFDNGLEKTVEWFAKQAITRTSIRSKQD